MSATLVTDTPARPVRVICFGGRGLLCQVTRLEQGLAEAGAVLATPDSDDVDLVYANDEPRWQEAIDYRAKVAPKAKLVLCVLDVPEISYPRFRPGDLYDRLCAADHLVTISGWVQSQLLRIFAKHSSVIGMPIKPVTPDLRLARKSPFSQYRALMAGRLRDPGKRADLAIQSLILAGVGPEEVAVVGGEYPGWGTDLGIVSDEVMNQLYNSVDFLMDTAIFQGLGLPMLEGLAGGALPIVCHDHPVAREFLPPQWACFPHPHSIAYRLATLINTPQWLDHDKVEALKIGAAVREALSPKTVATRLLDVYRDLVSTPSTPASP